MQHFIIFFLCMGTFIYNNASYFLSWLHVAYVKPSSAVAIASKTNVVKIQYLPLKYSGVRVAEYGNTQIKYKYLKMLHVTVLDKIHFALYIIKGNIVLFTSILRIGVTCYFDKSRLWFYLWIIW